MRHLLTAATAAALAAGSPALAQDDGPMSIVFTHHSSASNPFWQAVKRGFDEACGRIEADCQMIFTQTEGAVDQQASNMMAALAGQPDALITTIVDNTAFDGIVQQAVDAGVIVIASNVDDAEGADGNARAAFVGQGFVPAGRSLAGKMAEFFPEDGPIKAVIGVSAPGQNWSEQRGQGIREGLEAYRDESGREVQIVRLDTGTDGAVTADRVGAYLNANPDTTVYFDTGLWHAYVAQVLADRGVEPGDILMGGFDIVSEVLQQMEAGYIQVQVDQQPYMQGFMPVMQAHLAHTVDLAPADIDTGQGLVLAEDVPALKDLAAQGFR